MVFQFVRSIHQKNESSKLIGSEDGIHRESLDEDLLGSELIA
jgi:hypothetical protein